MSVKNEIKMLRKKAVQDLYEVDNLVGELYQYFRSDDPNDRKAMEWMDLANRSLRNAIAAAEGRPVARPIDVFKEKFF